MTLASYLLIVTGIYVGSMAPGQSSIRIETPDFYSAHDCNKAGAKWVRTLSYVGARDVSVDCKPMGR